MIAQAGDYRKKKGQKKGTNVPLSQLGFKSKVYYGIQTEYTRKRLKYKAARYGAENSKQCFMGRLTFILDPSTLTHDQLEALHNFKGISKHEWDKVKQIIYHSREELTCAICLEKSFVAPQMTQCGHVFCWHCIYMHHYKSLKANNCPVCNQTFSVDQVVTCKPIYARSFEELEQNKIKLALKCRVQGGKKIYNPIDYKEDLNFARVIKAVSEKIVSIYQLQKQQLEKYFKDCEDEQTKIWVAKIISLSYDKIEKANHQHQLKKEYRLHKNETKIDGFIVSTLEERTNIVNFYQEYSGKLIFIHPLCDKFLRSCNKILPLEIQEEIIEWEEVQYNIDLIRKYKQLHHIIINQQIDLVIINLKNLIPQSDYKQLQLELEQCKLKKQEQLEREDKQSERLQVIYEQNKEYIKKLKKMEESQFYDIKVPTTIDPKELGDNYYFPSLIQTKSMPDPEVPFIIPQQPKQPKEKKKKAVVLNEGDFPGLVLQKANKQQVVVQDFQIPIKLNMSKSQEPKLSKAQLQELQFPDMFLNNSKKNNDGPKFQKKNNRKKKEKFINVTDQFFQKKQDQAD